jgi:DNA modification methylase
MPLLNTNNKIHRVFAILRILQAAENVLTLRDIREELFRLRILRNAPGQTLRNIQRDIRVLRQLGFHIRNRRGRGYFLSEDRKTSPILPLRDRALPESTGAQLPTETTTDNVISYHNCIINGNCLDVIPTLQDAIIDMVVTSLPYNAGIEYDVYNDSKSNERYLERIHDVFAAIYPKLKSSGRVCLNVSDGANGRIQTHVDISTLMTRTLGYLPMATIVCDKENVSNRYSWGSFQNPKCPSFPCPFEYILIFAKQSLSLQADGKTDLTRDEFIKWSLAKWTFPKNVYNDSAAFIREKVHPSVFPEELPTRLIKMLSWVGATVLDPFVGIGTTCVACKKLKRNYLGIELSAEYCKVGRDRLNRIP